MASSISTVLNVDLGGPAKVQVDLSRVPMTDEQRAIVGKLVHAIRSTDRVSLAEQDRCEVGQCAASRHLSDDEFQKIRGIKASLGTDGATAGILCDFCLHFVAV